MAKAKATKKNPRKTAPKKTSRVSLESLPAGNDPGNVSEDEDAAATATNEAGNDNGDAPNVTQEQMNTIEALLATQGFRVTTIDDEEEVDEPDEDEVDAATTYFGMIEGLSSSQIGAARVTVDRTEPLYHNMIKTKGYCTTLSLPFSMEDIKERFGGGTYKFSLRIDPNERDGMNAPIHRTAYHTIVDPSFPKVGSLSSDISNQGVSLAPELQAKLDRVEGLEAEVNKLKATPAQATESLGDKLVAMLVEKQMESFMGGGERAAPRTELDILKDHYEMSDLIKKRGGGGGDDKTDDEEEEEKSDAQKMKDTVETVKDIVSSVFGEDGIFGKPERRAVNTRREIGSQQAQAEPEPVEESPAIPNAEEEAHLKQKIYEACEMVWGCLLNDGDHAKTIANKLDQFFKENVEQRWHKMIMDYFTEKNVMEWLEDTAKGNDQREKKIKAPRARKKIYKMVRIFRGEE